MVDMTRVKRKFKNRLPWVKFPLHTNLYKLVGQDSIKFLGRDSLRADIVDGKTFYIFKSNADAIIAFSYGSEDAGNTIDLLITGEGDYIVLKRSFNKEARDIAFEISLDEQAKFLYANQLELLYSRFDREKGFFEKYGATIVLIFALAIAGTIILVGSTSNIAGLSQATNALTGVINQQNNLISTLGKGVVGATAP